MKPLSLLRTQLLLATFALVVIAAAASSLANPRPEAKPPTPFFHFMWKEEISEPAVRLAVADTTGDGSPRLVLLAQNPLRSELASLVIKKWNGTEFVTEFTTEVNGPPDKLAVGKFAGAGKPAVIVVADGMWAWVGQKYIHKSTSRPLQVFGTAKKHSGEERLILSESFTKFKSYAINLNSDADWLTDPSDAPTATQVDWESMRATPEFFNKMGMPSYLGSGGLITIWDTTKANAPYLYYCRPAPQFDGSGGKPKNDSYVGLRDASDGAGNELWSTTKLNGLATDMALEDAKTAGRKGLLILTNSASEGKLRTIYFYGLG